MSDPDLDADSVPDSIEHESSDTDRFGLDKKPMAVSESERLSNDLKLNVQRVLSEDIKDDLASEHARQVLRDDLETLYQGDLDINNPPDSIEAFENRVTLRNLASLATRFGATPAARFEGRNITIDVEDNDSEPDSIESFESLLNDQSNPSEPTRAKKAIDRMATYGQPAEQFLAVVADDASVHPEIAEYALDALAELQEREEQADGLLNTLRSWWSGGRP